MTFKSVKSFRSTLRCRKYIEEISKSRMDILLVVSLVGCKSCSDLKRSLRDLPLSENALSFNLERLSLVFVSIFEPSQLLDLGLYPKEFPTTLLLQSGKIVKGWTGAVEAEDTVLQQAISKSIILHELQLLGYSSCLEKAGTTI